MNNNRNSNTIDQFIKYAIGGAALLGTGYLLSRAFNGTTEESHTISQSNRTEKYAGLYLEPKKPNLMMLDSLSNEVWSMYISNKESVSDFEEKLKVWNHLIEIMDEPNLEIFGSTLTGFALRNSDLDICIPSSGPLDRYDSYYKLVNHYEVLIKKSRTFTSILTVNAAIPIIKSKHHSDISVDISFKEPRSPSTYLLRMYNMADWRVAPLVVTVKLWSHRNKVNGAVNGFFSSYGLTLMVIYFLQKKEIVPFLLEQYHCQSNSNTDWSKSLCPTFRSSSKATLGELFLEFLQFYSSFDFDNYAISIRCRQTLRKPSVDWIYVENPFNQYKNNVTAAIKYDTFLTIKDVLKSSYSKLLLTHQIRNIL